MCSSIPPPSNNVFLIPNQNFWCFNLCSLAFILLLWTIEKSLAAGAFCKGTERIPQPKLWLWHQAHTDSCWPARWDHFCSSLLLQWQAWADTTWAVTFLSFLPSEICGSSQHVLHYPQEYQQCSNGKAIQGGWQASVVPLQQPGI